MAKIHIGLIGDVCQDVINSLPLGNSCDVRVFSNIAICNAKRESVFVAESKADINLTNATQEEIIEYIVDVCDVVISQNYCYVCDRARAKKGSLYIYDNIAKLGLRSMSWQDEKIADYIKNIGVTAQEKQDNANPFWKGAYAKFFKKFKRKSNASVFNENIDKNSQLYEQFNKYDEKANKYNAIYRSSLYLRALLPLMATLTLAFAQNTKVFGEFIFGGKFWGLASAFLFLAQAMFNYIIIALSNYIVRRFVIENFIHNRYMAESLRMVMLLAPNSLPRLKTQRIVFTDVDNKMAELDNGVNCIYRLNYKVKNSFNSDSCGAIKEQLLAMAHNQMGYHKNNASNCGRAEKYVTNFAKAFFVCGLIAVLGRGVYQVVLQFVNIGATVNGVTVGTFFLSVMNFLALLIPACTTMFMDLKKGLNISNNRARSQVTAGLLDDYIQAVESIDNVCYSNIYPSTFALSDILIQEALDWNTATEQHKVSKM